MDRFIDLVPETLDDPKGPTWDVPAALAARVDGLAETQAARRRAESEAREALDAPCDYADEADRAVAVRDQAIREAGRAVATGGKRPTIPAAPDPDKVRAEVEVLVIAARAKVSAANRLADKEDATVLANAEHLAAMYAEAYAPNVAEAEAALTTYLAKADAANALLRAVVSLRAAGLLHANLPRRQSLTDRANVVEALVKGGDQAGYFEARQAAERNARLALLTWVTTLKEFDVAAAPAHPDMLPADADRIAMMRRMDDPAA